MIDRHVSRQEMLLEAVAEAALLPVEIAAVPKVAVGNDIVEVHALRNVGAGAPLEEPAEFVTHPALHRFGAFGDMSIPARQRLAHGLRHVGPAPAHMGLVRLQRPLEDAARAQPMRPATGAPGTTRCAD